jgi:hypothetical protein
MRNRNLINRKLENLESTLTTLRRIVNTQEPIDVYKINIGKALTTIEELKDMIEMEPLGPREMNKI